MQEPFVYVKSAARLAKLHMALLAAGITPVSVSGQGNTIWIQCVDAQTKGPVDTVVAAYDPTIPSQVELDLAQDRADLAEARDQLAAMNTRLDQIITAASPTNAQVIQAVRDLATHQKRILKALVVLARRG